jgi:hypothetical protein
MKGQGLMVTMCALLLAIPALGGGKKHTNNRAMIEKMEAVPCGAKERGLSGLGSVFASVGATRIDSDEKLCPQYMLRTDEMEYHVRPLDHKHPRILPVGQEAEFKINKDVIEMRVVDGDHTKRRYQVVAMKPIDHAAATDTDATGAKYTQPHKDYPDKSLAERTPTDRQASKTPVPPPPPPQ